MADFIRQILVFIFNLSLVILFVLISACSSGQKKKNVKNPVPPKGVHLKKSRLLIKNAYAARPIGKGVFLFLRRSSVHHNQPQVYLKNKKKEQQLTFNRSENLYPVYKPQNSFVYVSGLDELKEFPKEIFVNKNKIQWPFSEFEKMIYGEIYLRNFKTYFQKRLTQHGGLDYHPSMNSEFSGFVYVSQEENGNYVLKNYNFKRGSSRKILSSKNVLLFPAHSSSDKLIWVEYDANQKISYVKQLRVEKIKKKRKTIKKYEQDLVFQVSGLIHSLSWSLDEKTILASIRSFKENRNGGFEIYAFNREKNCHIRQTYSRGDEVDVRFSINEKSLVYSFYQATEPPEVRLLDLDMALPCHLLN